MADYRFPPRKQNPSFQVYPCNEEWSHSSDHSTYPVGIMDSAGRRSYGTAWSPGQKPDGYLVQTEKYIVYPPAFSRYEYPRKADYWGNYNVIEDDQWRRSPHSPRHERPPEVEEFLTKVQTEASRPWGFPRQVSRTWSHIRDPPEHEDRCPGDQYVARQPIQFSVPPPARGNWVENPNPVSYGTYPIPPGHQPRVITELPTPPPPPPALGPGSWAIPSRSNSSRQPGRDSILSQPINDIDALVGYLKDAVKLSSSHMTTQPNYDQSISSKPVPKPASPKRDAPLEISTVEGVKPRNNSKPSAGPEPSTADAVYTGTMTSREAAKRFNGVIMWALMLWAISLTYLRMNFLLVSFSAFFCIYSRMWDLLLNACNLHKRVLLCIYECVCM